MVNVSCRMLEGHKGLSVGKGMGSYSRSFHMLDLVVPVSVQPTTNSEEDLCLAHSKCSIHL